MKRAIAAQQRLEQELFEEPAGVRQMPLGRARVRHALHDVVLRLQRLADLERDAADVRSSGRRGLLRDGFRGGLEPVAAPPSGLLRLATSCGERGTAHYPTSCNRKKLQDARPAAMPRPAWLDRLWSSSCEVTTGRIVPADASAGGAVNHQSVTVRGRFWSPPVGWPGHAPGGLFLTGRRPADLIRASSQTGALPVF